MSRETPAADIAVRPAAVALIYLREMQDQFRDRRTLFTILVLPVLLYPLVGTLLMQITQFGGRSAVRVAIVGEENLAGLPPLVAEPSESAGRRSPDADWSAGEVGSVRFHPDLTDQPEDFRLSLFRSEALGPSVETPVAEQWVRDGLYDAVIIIPAGGDSFDEAPTVGLVYNIASESSAAARLRVGGLLQRWKNAWIRESLDRRGLSTTLLEPFEIAGIDAAPRKAQQSSFWSKVLPMVMLIWAMTGAFYPAIDMVAGEKERGTLETLLCSPASRGELVWGKLAAVTTFSMLTAVLNSASMLTTGAMVLSKMDLGQSSPTPSATTLLWLLAALVPLAAMFSAVALGIAALARSSKEGQYYLMPLMLVILPLVLLPMMPGITLSTGMSLVPVSGMFLLARAFIEGQYAAAIMHLPLVAGVTLGCLAGAVRWARSRFENESILFHGGETSRRSGLVEFVRRLRREVITENQAYAAALVILVMLFFGKLLLPAGEADWASLVRAVTLPQLVMILLPTLVFAVLLSRSPARSLGLNRTSFGTVGLSLVIGVALHPIYMILTQWVAAAYPLSGQALQALAPLNKPIAAAPWLHVVLLMAVLPAVCEELAFRGVVFGGLLRGGEPGRAVAVSAVAFGISHGVLQQSISATMIGLLLGWVTWRTASVVPAMIIHAINNGLSVSLPRISELDLPGLELVLAEAGAGVVYQPMWTLICLGFVLAVFIIYASMEPEGCCGQASRGRLNGSAVVLQSQTSG